MHIAARNFANIDELEQFVIKAATDYEINGYAEDIGGVEITDPQYDEAIRTLRKEKPSSKALQGTSPSTAKQKGGIVVHNPPMTSIAKADGTDQEKLDIYKKWIENCETRLGKKNLKLAQSYKRDGVAVRVNYVKGKFVSAGQRPRDGVNGTDVTRHIKYIEGIPDELPLPLTLSLNGEIECWLDEFEALNQEREAAGEDTYKNPRNYTAGCLGRDNPEENKNSRLRIAFYSITGFEEWDQYYKTEIERAKWANSEEGLNLQKDGKGYFVQVRRHEDSSSFETMEKNSKALPYYTDGVILKVDDLELQEELGHSGDSLINEPRGALAWKYAEETTEATVSRIEWNASRTGRVVPTAIFDIPFVLADTSNTRATCNNFGWMRKQGLGPGAVVRVKKAGKIIPNIFEVVTPVSYVSEPDLCPTCRSTLILHKGGGDNEDLQCKNADCGAKHLKSWVFYLQNLGSKGLGEAAMQKILRSGTVKSLPDLYELEVSDLMRAGFTERESLLALAAIFIVKPVADNEKLLKSIEKARAGKYEIEAAKFFAALGIPGAGNSAGKALIQHYRSFDLIRQASTEELQKIEGIGTITGQAIAEWLKTNSNMINRLLKYVELQLPKTGKLTGKNFVLTGAFGEGKKHWEEKIEAEGGNIQSSVGRHTNYLVQELGKSDGSPSSKEAKAIDLGIEIISIPDLEALL